MASFEKRIRRVRAAFSAGELCTACVREESEFGTIFQRYYTGKDNLETSYWFEDNGASVLAVAHLDSVETKQRVASVHHTAINGKIVFSPTLDDRLGVYVITNLLPKLGIKTDILLTTGEESGRSTADLFKAAPRQYNWMFQFDRKGTDVVMYHYKTKDYEKMLEAVGFKTAFGSFSDICKLTHLKCAGFNFGVGYEDYHSRKAFAWLDDTFEMVARFTEFYEKHKDTYLEHKGGSSYGSSSYRGGYSGYEDWDTVYGGNRYAEGYWGRWVKGPTGAETFVRNPERVKEEEEARKRKEQKTTEEANKKAPKKYRVLTLKQIQERLPDAFDITIQEDGFWATFPHKGSGGGTPRGFTKWKLKKVKKDTEVIKEEITEMSSDTPQGDKWWQDSWTKKYYPPETDPSGKGYWLIESGGRTWVHTDPKPGVAKEEMESPQQRPLPITDGPSGSGTSEDVGDAEFQAKVEERLRGRVDIENSVRAIFHRGEEVIECVCGHPQWIHHRGPQMDKCNYWKCLCKGYVEAPDSSVVGG